jgi:hypothetical protein
MGIGRFAVTILILFAFALQSYLIQTHIHGDTDTSAHTCAAQCLTHAPAKAPLPLGKAAIDCPLCHALVNAGAFFVPTALIPFVPQVLWSVLSLPAKTPVIQATLARDGLSRAPPR